MTFWFDLACVAIAMFGVSYTAGRRRWRCYIVPGALTLLFVAALDLFLAYMITCDDCGSHQSGLEELRTITIVYTSVAFVVSLFVWAAAYALGRRTRSDVA